MIYDKTLRGAELANRYKGELEKLTVQFFEECKGKKESEIKEIFNNYSEKWLNFCTSINKLKNWPVRMVGGEFVAVTVESYTKVFLSKGRIKGRRSMLRTIRLLENKNIIPYIYRYIRLSFIKLFQ